MSAKKELKNQQVLPVQPRSLPTNVSQDSSVNPKVFVLVHLSATSSPWQELGNCSL